MRQIILLTIVICTSIFAQSQTTNDTAKPLTIGEIRTIHSNILNEDRVLNIYLPDNFDKTKSYTVLYLLDGSMNEDFLHIVGLIQFFNLQFKMPETIVVGIKNVDRKRDFTFHTDLKDLQQKYPTTGHSDLFISFLENELLPFINKTYKTDGTNYLLGQSLGGLLACEILLKNASLFTHYFIVSPSLWWDNESMLKQAKTLFAAQKDEDRYVYIAVGKDEPSIMIKESKKIYDVLKESDKKHLKLDYQLMTDDNHATILHNAIYTAFLKLFPFKE